MPKPVANSSQTPLEAALQSIGFLPQQFKALDLQTMQSWQTGSSAWMQAALQRFLPSQPNPSNTPQTQQFLYSLAADYPARGGKHFRPALMLLCASLHGGDARLALPSAVALELFQNFALVHDDLEDHSLLRRGKPTLHLLHNPALAINAGDLLFALCYEALALNASLLGAARAWRVQQRFAQGVRRTLEGQALDIGWIHKRMFPSREMFEEMIACKTGWYSGRIPCEIGAMICEAPREEREILGDFGEVLGVGFQLRDDLLNLAQSSSKQAPSPSGGGYGKERGGDFAEGKRTLIVIEMLERLPAAQATRLTDILHTPAESTKPADIQWALEAAQHCGALQAVQQRCRLLHAHALQHLRRLPPSPQRDILEQVATLLIHTRKA